LKKPVQDARRIHPICRDAFRRRHEIEKKMKEAIAFHLAGLREEGRAIPEPRTFSTSTYRRRSYQF
jgi:hypothetical protein